MEAGSPGCPPYPEVMDILSPIGDTLAPGKITKRVHCSSKTHSELRGWEGRRKRQAKGKELVRLEPSLGTSDPSCSRERRLLSLGTVFLTRSCAETAGRREGRGGAGVCTAGRGCWAQHLPGAAWYTHRSSGKQR